MRKKQHRPKDDTKAPSDATVDIVKTFLEPLLLDGEQTLGEIEAKLAVMAERLSEILAIPLSDTAAAAAAIALMEKDGLVACRLIIDVESGINQRSYRLTEKGVRTVRWSADTLASIKLPLRSRTDRS
jgi:hypothetical protein